ncbi:MAG: tellurite resistance TerB family protein [Alphaproteobacteria bacterium]|jgi:tellurite resistance protein|nr:tellurite resistance TerB family protein [Rhodospirillaceae bacterium]MDG2480923.1 tellurite resistance TerB family protein [Alphaproteobacteria bacterium]MBT6205604.1 tellurite resistance TerB family protein [Rhodospirillaceae bacterium]MBT6509732.1 tellurite resistance TerB family protein [Rhodospirillaceae bacterium]MBT7612618.1 tellurite resistance TerB family protein [Rhodospirillaceae bacterium]
MTQLDPHAALIYTMVVVSAADGSMDDDELRAIGDIVRHLPAFTGFDENELPRIAEACAALLADEDGFETVITIISENLPDKLRETAYAIACDIAAANLEVDEDEMTILQQIRWRLSIDRLTATAIERGSRARHQTV